MQMNMKKWLVLSLIMGAMPLSMTAQDDMYFVPTKERVAKEKAQRMVERETYYSGINRSVDDYNRRGSYYQVIEGDSLNDVIDFSPVEGVYPDSLDDYQLTRRMARFDGYEPADNFWAGYSAGRRDAWAWHSPWYYSAYYPWYDSWYDPWYYGRSWYAGWYDPWYYDWYYPYYGWGGYYRPWHYGYYGHYGHYGYAPHYGVGRSSGTIDRYGRSHGVFSGNRATAGRTTGNARVNSRNSSARNRTVSGHTNYSTESSTSRSSSSGSFSGSRSSSGSFGSSSSGGSFGGSRSSGGGGGGRSGGIGAGGRR